METIRRSEMVLNHDDTELRLGLPGTIEEMQGSNKKRSSPDSSIGSTSDLVSDPLPKAQVVGWPPVRSYRRNYLQANKPEEGMFVKVSMDGAPYLRKIDLKLYKGYQELLKALEEMFDFKAGSYSEQDGYIRGSEFEPAYEDKDGDWMLVGDVPWEMFMSSCKRLRIMKG